MEQPSPQSLRLIACPHILSIEKGRIDVERTPGGTIADLLHSIGWTQDGLNARVYVDGELVHNARWEYVTPHGGQSVIVRAIPMGGGGKGKDAMRIVAMLGVLVAAIAAPYLAPAAWGIAAGTLGGALASASISIVGTLALNGLIPTPLPRRTVQQKRLAQARPVKEAA